MWALNSNNASLYLYSTQVYHYIVVQYAPWIIECNSNDLLMYTRSAYYREWSEWCALCSLHSMCSFCMAINFVILTKPTTSPHHCVGGGGGGILHVSGSPFLFYRFITCVKRLLNLYMFVWLYTFQNLTIKINYSQLKLLIFCLRCYENVLSSSIARLMNVIYT